MATDLVEHVAHRRCLGFYPLRPDNTCVVSALDFDGSHEADWRERAERISATLTAARYPHVVELSQSGKGAHVWIFLDGPTPARDVRNWWRVMLARADVSCREIYPRQDAVDPDKPLGNLIRYPLWGKSAFVEVPGWQPLDPAAVVAGIKRVGGERIRRESTAVIEPTHSGLSPLVVRMLSVPAIARRWDGDTSGLADKSRSGLAMALAMQLVRRFVPTQDIEQALRAWGTANGYAKAARPEWIGTTLRNAYTQARASYSDDDEKPETLRHYLAQWLAENPDDQRAIVCPFGVGVWDTLHDGVGLGELCLLAGRPSHGKSALALQWAGVQSARGVSVVVVSEEMTPRAIAKRYALHTGLNNPTPGDIAAAEASIADHWRGRAPIWVYRSLSTIERVEAVTTRHVEEHGCRCLVVDYLQLLTSAAGRAPRHELIGAVSQRLRQMATRLGIAIVAAVQFNRAVEREDTPIPRLCDLGDSGQLERDADIVVALRWPWKDDPNAERSEINLYTLKRRNGEIKEVCVKAHFDPTTQRIT